MSSEPHGTQLLRIAPGISVRFANSSEHPGRSGAVFLPRTALAVDDRPLGLGSSSPSAVGHLVAFATFVNEEMGYLLPKLIPEVGNICHGLPVRILEGNTDHLWLQLTLVVEPQHGDRLGHDATTRERRFRNRDEDIKWILTLLVERFRDEAVVDREDHRGRQETVQKHEIVSGSHSYLLRLPFGISTMHRTSLILGFLPAPTRDQRPTRGGA